MEPMTLALLAGGIGALAGGGGAMVGGMSANKNRAKPGKIQPYGGPRPRSTNPTYTGPIENMISETLMRRSQGQDVGFDPKRAEQLKSSYDIDYNRAKESMTSDALNRLSGSGQSKNLAAQEALIGDREKYMADTRSKYQMGVDVEDLARKNQERENATRMLQEQNKFNFNQDNEVANFGLNEAQFNATGVMGNYNMENQYAQQYQDPFAAGISGAGSGMESGMNMAAMSGALNKAAAKTPNIGGAYGDVTNLKGSPIYKRMVA
jgi:hypothetical protein